MSGLTFLGAFTEDISPVEKTKSLSAYSGWKLAQIILLSFNNTSYKTTSILAGPAYFTPITSSAIYIPLLSESNVVSTGNFIQSVSSTSLKIAALLNTYGSITIAFYG